jgi:hypothetical protein
MRSSAGFCAIGLHPVRYGTVIETFNTVRASSGWLQAAGGVRPEQQEPSLWVACELLDRLCLLEQQSCGGSVAGVADR